MSISNSYQVLRLSLIGSLLGGVLIDAMVAKNVWAQADEPPPPHPPHSPQDQLVPKPTQELHGPTRPPTHDRDEYLEARAAFFHRKAEQARARGDMEEASRYLHMWRRTLERN